MTIAERGASAPGAAAPSGINLKNWGLIAAIAALIAILLLPTPAGLPLAGQRMLAIFGFAVLVWISEAFDYAISAIVIAALMAVLLGLSPSIADPKVLYGSVQGLTMAMSGFGNTALTLVAAALFLAAAMTITGLDRRIALMVLRRVGARTDRVVIGSIVVAIILAFLVPSATARAAAVIPIMMGVVAAFGVERKSRFAGMMMITTVQAVSIWNVGIKTAAAQNMIAVGFFQSILHQDVTWVSWLVAAAPLSLLLSVGLYYIMMYMMPPEAAEMPGGQAAVEKALAGLGPMSAKEKRLLAISLILLCFWATEGILHHFDSSTTTTVAVALLFLPYVGVMEWKKANTLIPWGTVVLFGVGISLGTALLQTQAAQWLAGLIVQWFGLNQLTGIAVLAVMATFLVIIHLGFASATALAATMIPIIIAIVQKVQTPGISVVGITLLLQFVVSYGFILPVNSPQGMLAYGTETFAVRDFVRTGIVITVLAYVLTL
ncbi:MAG TPA: DASS family sodium-coupled anion symporter, partial [Xanthobacteraceae bacterium]|nr:DASS family sodium-coupled anion symporter [Xanthobacteraceae bacterium]